MTAYPGHVPQAASNRVSSDAALDRGRCLEPLPHLLRIGDRLPHDLGRMAQQASEDEGRLLALEFDGHRLAWEGLSRRAHGVPFSLRPCFSDVAAAAFASKNDSSESSSVFQ